MKLSDVITPGDKIDIKMLHEANQEDNGGEIAKIYQSAVSDIFSDQELEISMPTSGGRMVLFQLERECSIVFYTKGGMYNCTAVVKKRYRKENLYLLRIVITSGLQKFQRREFFRIPYTTPLKYYEISEQTAQMQTTEELFAELVEQVKHPKVVAVGECGLDYHWDTSPVDLQKEVFIRQIKLAHEVNKPLVIHTRESIADTLEILKAHDANVVGGVMHCYSGSVEMARQFIDLNFKISLGGPVTFTNGRRPQAVATEIALEDLLVETDAPYLTPHPHRGTRNEPFYVSLVAKKISELKNLPYETVCEQTTANACALFKIK